VRRVSETTTSRESAIAQIVGGIVLIVVSIFVALWDLLAWTVTASTGVPSQSQDDWMSAIGWMCLAAFVLGVVLLVRGIVKLPRKSATK
jgi:hypothetical protein